MARTLETVLIGRDLLSPVLTQAAGNVKAYDAAVTSSQARSSASAQASSTAQASAYGRAAEASTVGARAQNAASTSIVGSNTRAAESATASSAAQQRAHAKAAESAALSARAQQAASGALTASNGLLGASLTPLTAGLGAVALGLGYAAFRGAQFDSAMSQVQAATMAAGGEMESLRDLAIKLGADTQYSGEEAAQGITELAKAGVATADIMGGGLAGALDLAAAGQLEVADAAEIAATQMVVFNLKGNQMSHVADLLAAGAGKAQGSVQDMALALQYAGLPAAGLGLSIEETTGALGLFASNGLVGEKAGTSFRGMLVALTNPAEKTRVLMDDLNLSFFDAQGQFVGMEGVADQLQQRLGGLTVEQRNSALAQIFGNEALGAAQALYNGGAAGVATWTRNVNDAGYAAEQAAKLNDNLRGDLEKLGGAFDATMTQIGSGTQGPLRFLVQTLTDIIDAGGDFVGWISDLPGPVQAAAIAIAAVYIAAGPLGNLFPTIAANARIAFATIQAQAALSGGAVALLTTSVAAARTAIAGLLTTLAPFAVIAAAAGAIARMVDVSNAAEDAKAAVDELTAAYDDGTGPEKYRAVAGALDQVQDAASKARGRLSELRNMSGLERFFQWDYAGDVRKAEASVEAYEGAVDRLRDASDRADQSAEVLGNRYGITRQQVEDFADAHGIDLSGSLQIVQSDFMRVFESTAAYDAQTGKATVTAEEYAKAIGEGDTAIKNLIASLDILRGGQLSVTEAENAFGSALDAAKKALDDKDGSVLDATGNLNSYSESGRATYDALTALSDGANETIAAMIRQGESSETLVAKDAELRQAFFDTALQMTGNRQAAEDLTNQYFGIPEERQTRIDALIEQAMANAGTITDTVNNLPDGNIDVYANTAPAEQTLQQFLSTYRGVTIGTGSYRGEAPVGSSGLPGLPDVPGKALGGRLSGPGTGTSDSILGVDAFTGMPTAWVSNREYVVNERQTDRNLALIEAINAGSVPAGINPDDLRYLADGGRAALGGLKVDVSASTAGWASMVEAAAPTPAGGGAIGSGWQALFSATKAAFPQARANSTVRPGDPGYHGSGRAVDLGQVGRSGGAGHPYLAAMNRWWYDNYGSSLAELIYDGLGDDRPDIKNGRPHVYSAATRAQHANHVHVARALGGRIDLDPGSILNPHIRDSGGPLLPGFTYNGLGRPETVVATPPAASPGYGAAAVPMVNVSFFVDGQEFRGMARSEAVIAMSSLNRNLNGRGVRP